MGTLDRRLVPLERVAATRREHADRAAMTTLRSMSDDALALLLGRLTPLYALMSKELLHGEPLTPDDVRDLELAYNGCAELVGPAVTAWAERRLDDSPHAVEAMVRAFLETWEREQSEGAPCAG